jgi:hypothetical protein
MHARIDQLLSLRDGEPQDASVVAHVESCHECSGTLKSLQALRRHLNDMPLVPADPSGWTRIESRIAARAGGSRLRARAARVLVAASVASLAVIAAVEIAGKRGRPVDPVPMAVSRPAAAAGRVDDLRRTSLALEAVLAGMPSRPVVERADTALPIEALEAQVQWLDHQLTLAGAGETASLDAERLWRERVEAMDSLVRLRYVETQRSVL